eukprot:84331-Lingulodinium_polyedra.AAC.1
MDQGICGSPLPQRACVGQGAQEEEEGKGLLLEGPPLGNHPMQEQSHLDGGLEALTLAGRASKSQ